MDTDEHADLYDLAVELALDAFKEADDEHAEAVYERLLFNKRHGLGLASAVTVH